MPLRTTKTVTQKDVAHAAGVTAGTVSRVLNAPVEERRKWASDEKIELILQVATTLGYRGHPHARSLRTARSEIVGVIVPRLQDFVLATVFEGVDAAAEADGYTAVVANSLDDDALRRTKIERMLDRRADGLILCDARIRDDGVLDDLTELGVPYVLASRRSEGRPAVTGDDELGGALVANHLLDSGRTRFAVIAGLDFASTAVDRVDGFRRAASARGIEVPDAAIQWFGFDAEAGARSMSALLALRPDAVFATNDFAAIGALGVLLAAGLRVPDDVALVGYNDTPLAGSIGVPLTTVSSPMRQIGEQAFAQLREVMAGAPARSVRLEPQLVIRRSSRAA